MEDAVYQAGIEWLAALLAMQGLEAPVTAQILEDETGHSCWLTISEENLTPEQAGYRAKRLGELKAMALEAAEQVLASGQSYELKGLSSAERRQLHHVLKAQDGLSTFSRGKEPDRRLVVCLESAVQEDP